MSAPTVMSDAEATVRFAILNGISEEYNDSEKQVDAIYKYLFKDGLVWALKKVLEEKGL